MRDEQHGRVEHITLDATDRDGRVLHAAWKPLSRTLDGMFAGST